MPSDNGHGVLWALRTRIAGVVLGKTYDPAWFARFLKLASEEDWATGAGLTDAYKQHAWVNIAVSAIARNLYAGRVQAVPG